MTHDEPAPTHAPTPVRGIEDLLAYFHDAETPRADWLVGTEHEKVGLRLDTLERMPYEGECGVRALLSRVAELDDWSPVYEGEGLIALLKDGASITLEPGGQIELSGAPLQTAGQTCSEFHNHVDLVGRVAAELGVAFLGLGIDPFHTVPEIPHMPKTRYRIMREYLPTRGSLGLAMMHQTATVQANYDFESERDMASKMRAAMRATVAVSALFANSSIAEGKESGFISRRIEIWRDTDPDRCGLLDFVLREDFGYRDYAEWALDVPMFFVVRDHQYVPAGGTTFRQFMERGYEGHSATIDDWDLHLTTLFPEVRLKRFIEVRGADAAPKDLLCALPTLWKGILYDDDATAATLELTRKFGIEDLEVGLADVARRGLQAQLAGGPVIDVARELVSISGEGLRRIRERGETEADERPFLEPALEVLERGKSPGEVVLERWRGEWGGSRERLIEATRY